LETEIAMHQLNESLREPGAKHRALKAIDTELGRAILRGARVETDRARSLIEDPEREDRLSVLEAATGGSRPHPLLPERMVLEAIVRLSKRPVYLVQGGRVDLTTGLDTFDVALEPHRASFDGAIPGVGKVELRNHRMDWAGTAWLVEEDLVVTNRHVAQLFAQADGRGGFRFSLAAPGIPYEASIDFLEEHGRAEERSVQVSAIEYIAPSDGPDIALLRLAGRAGEPIRLADSPLGNRQLIGIIGYPADDSRNSASAIEKYFGAIFDKKRFAPGYVTSVPRSTDHYFTHDCTTLGGNSGSAAIDLETGYAVGLHFAGKFREANFAVTAETLKKMLAGTKVFVTVPAPGPERPDGTHEPGHFKGRTGYDERHLGNGTRVPLPDFSSLATRIVTPEGGSGPGGAVADYEHFSLVLHDRGVPLFTAVNIDGGQARRIKRRNDTWHADLRYPRGAQLRREHYDHPQIDRGHMVRREDPNWGESAELANADTFHYTNAAPQHADLNQGKTAWLGLENYILDSARTEGLKVCVFTGPVLRDDDRVLQTGGGSVAVPEEFWKVVVALDSETHAPRATAYLLGQGRLLDDLESVEFRYAQYGTYQVSVRSIEDATGLNFGSLRDTDPLESKESPGHRVRHFIAEPEEMIL
jgi:endonuclease G, mitochondrial